MKAVLLIIIGIIGGVIGGMGMGGGTLLIPLLTIFAGVEQHTAQALNLIAFVPMSVIALAIHIKNKLVDFKQFLWISLPAAVSGVLASLLGKSVGARSLSRYFGIFLTVLGVYQLITAIIAFVKSRREKRREDLTVTSPPPRSISGTLD